MNTNIFRIVFGLIFIIGGLSGKLVLRGTSSSFLLVIVGAGFLIWEAIKIFDRREPKKQLNSTVLCPHCSVKNDIPRDGAYACISCSGKFSVGRNGCVKE